MVLKKAAKTRSARSAPPARRTGGKAPSRAAATRAKPAARSGAAVSAKKPTSGAKPASKSKPASRLRGAIERVADKLRARRVKKRSAQASPATASPAKRTKTATPPKRSGVAAATLASRSAAATAPAVRPAAVRRPVTGEPAAQKNAGLEVGARAPGFDLLDHNAQMFSSYSLEGHPYILYFYPKDDTPGCTKEACAFRDSLNRFARRGISIIGVSPDAPGAHARFREKYGLNFRLLSDTDKELANAYGVWVKKKNYGREYMGIERSTYLVDREGIVRRVWRNVKVPGHAEAVLAEAERLL